jgi:hypothetical protein
MEPASLDRNARRGLAFAVRPEGPSVMVVWGGVESTMKDREDGVGSAFPARSLAVTKTVCGPSASGAVDSGEAHVDAAALSSRHANVEPGSFEAKRNSATRSFVRGFGLRVMVVCGGAVSVKLQLKVYGIDPRNRSPTLSATDRAL